MSLFEEGEIEREQSSQKIPNIPEFKDAQKMKFEKEALGMYLTTHPMKEYEQYLKGRITDVLGNINPEVGTDDEEDVASKSSAYREGQRVKLAGLITTIKTIVIGFIVSFDDPFNRAVNRLVKNGSKRHYAFLVHASQ